MNLDLMETNISTRQRPRILCVDDDAPSMSLLALILQRQGYEVLTALGPLAGLRVLRREAVDLALMDYEMPLLNGGELAAIVKHQDLAPKIILFSGSPFIPKPYLAFVDRLIHKSDGVEVLLDAIASVLTRPSAIPHVQCH